ncbi:ku70-like protein [Crepidotus variabilis]|uniref:ATP-dependent DNA helicase II subunit 1 n=1 Tax=Crepidotus variabilis TaxID=179855 RepID=A0A9P6E5B3_9AGAR|nr:ku70-like protein [Crepidotus variabilis]
MPPYDDWNKIDEEEEEEIQDNSIFESKRDVILFCIDCSASMLKLYDDPNYEDVQTCHLYTALEAAVQIQKRKILVGPNDSVGILLFNTSRKAESTRGQGAEIKRNTYLFQPIAPLSASKIQEIIQLLDTFREDTGEFLRRFPPVSDGRVPMGDVFTSCNWVMRDGAPKTASKRIFLITDEDTPHPSTGRKQLVTSARTTLIDLTQAGVTVEPFFISTEEKSFDVTSFYSSVLLPTNLIDEEELQEDSSILPESISISRIEDLLSQMRFREVPKRAIFSVPFELANGLKIGVKGYGLVTEQKKGSYKYFVDLGDRMEVATVRTTYVDEDHQAEVEKAKMVYGAELGANVAPEDGEEEDETIGGAGVRTVKSGSRPFYTAEEARSFRTLDLEPGIKLLGFKPREELAFEDNVKHSLFVFPDEMTYSGSKRTFSALLRTMIRKKVIAIVRALTRRNATPVFCALLPQEENIDESGWTDPTGFHLIPLPFADEVRTAPIEEGFRASDEMKDLARAWIDKLSVKNGAYPPDSYPNPALAYHNIQLQASAFREEFDPDSFEDLTLPKYDMIHKRAGKLIQQWKEGLSNDNSANLVVPAAAGSKRKADVSVDEAEIKSKYDSGTLGKLRVDQLKEFLKSKGQSVAGKKADLVDRVSEWFDAH